MFKKMFGFGRKKEPDEIPPPAPDPVEPPLPPEPDDNLVYEEPTQPTYEPYEDAYDGHDYGTIDPQMGYMADAFDDDPEDAISQLAEINSAMYEEPQLEVEEPNTDFYTQQTVNEPTPPAPQPVEHVSLEPAAAEASSISLPVSALLPAFPPECLAGDLQSIVQQHGGNLVEFHRSEVNPGLAVGRVDMGLGDLARRMPAECFSDGVDTHLTDQLELPLGDLLQVVPPSWFAISREQDLSKEMIVEEMEDLFADLEAPGEDEDVLAPQAPATFAEAVSEEDADRTIEMPQPAEAPVEHLPQFDAAEPEPAGLQAPSLEPPVSEPEPEPDPEPELAAPTLQAPTLQVPALEAPTLDAPAEPEPEPEIPSLAAPSIEAPSFEPEPSLEAPSLTPPSFEEPVLEPEAATEPEATFDAPSLAPPTIDEPTLEPEPEPAPHKPLTRQIPLPPIAAGDMPTMDDSPFGEDVPAPAPAPTPEFEPFAEEPVLEPEEPAFDLAPEPEFAPEPELEPEPAAELALSETPSIPEPIAEAPAPELEPVPTFEAEPEAALELPSEPEPEPAAVAPPSIDAPYTPPPAPIPVPEPEPVAAPAPVEALPPERPAAATIDEPPDPDSIAVIREEAREIFQPAQTITAAVETIEGATPGQPATGYRSGAPNGIDINSAGVEQLSKLAGIGAHTAKLIIEFREANGPFEKVQDLLKIPGLGSHTYRSMTRMTKSRDLKTTELAINGTFGVTGEAVSLIRLADSARLMAQLEGIVISSSDGLVLAKSNSPKLQKLTEGLAGAAPQLYRRGTKALIQANLPACDMTTFYIGKHAVTFAGSDQIFIACVHGTAYPNQKQLRLCRKLATELAWYCSYRAVVG